MISADPRALYALPRCPECGRETRFESKWSLYLYCPVHGPVVPRPDLDPLTEYELSEGVGM